VTVVTGNFTSLPRDNNQKRAKWENYGEIRRRKPKESETATVDMNQCILSLKPMLYERATHCTWVYISSLGDLQVYCTSLRKLSCAGCKQASY